MHRLRQGGPVFIADQTVELVTNLNKLVLRCLVFPRVPGISHRCPFTTKGSKTHKEKRKILVKFFDLSVLTCFDWKMVRVGRFFLYQLLFVFDHDIECLKVPKHIMFKKKQLYVLNN